MLEAVGGAALLHLCSSHQLRRQAPPSPLLRQQSQLQTNMDDYQLKLSLASPALFHGVITS